MNCICRSGTLLLEQPTPFVCNSLANLSLPLIYFIGTGDFFVPSFQCPHIVERVGVLGDGGKWVCGVDRVASQEKCVIYSFGAFFFLSSEQIGG